jgi:hypothetical protein
MAYSLISNSCFSLDPYLLFLEKCWLKEIKQILFIINRIQKTLECLCYKYVARWVGCGMFWPFLVMTIYCGILPHPSCDWLAVSVWIHCRLFHCCEMVGIWGGGKSVLQFCFYFTIRLDTSFANKRRQLGRYSSLADYKPRSLVLLGWTCMSFCCCVYQWNISHKFFYNYFGLSLWLTVGINSVLGLAMLPTFWKYQRDYRLLSSTMLAGGRTFNQSGTGCQSNVHDDSLRVGLELIITNHAVINDGYKILQHWPGAYLVHAIYLCLVLHMLCDRMMYMIEQHIFLICLCWVMGSF